MRFVIKIRPYVPYASTTEISKTCNRKYSGKICCVQLLRIKAGRIFQGPRPALQLLQKEEGLAILAVKSRRPVALGKWEANCKLKLKYEGGWSLCFSLSQPPMTMTGQSFDKATVLIMTSMSNTTTGYVFGYLLEYMFL